jgi:hypothetical protein
MGDNYGIINKKGDLVINPQFAQMGSIWIDYNNFDSTYYSNITLY